MTQAVIPILVTITNAVGAAISTDIMLEIRARVHPFLAFHQQVATVILTALITTMLVSAITTSCMLTVLTIALGSDHQTITATLTDLLTRVFL